MKRERAPIIGTLLFLSGLFWSSRQGMEMPARAQERPIQKKAAEVWTKPVHGIQCRLHITHSKFDVDELLPCTPGNDKTDVFLSVKNTTSDPVQVKFGCFTVRLLVSQNGKPVAPVFEQDWQDTDPDWDPRLGFSGKTIKGNEEISFSVFFLQHDANFGNPLARYRLRPGRYQVKGIFRTSICGNYKFGKPFQIETNSIEITVTGTEKPLPRWTRSQPLVLDSVPAATKELSRRLLKLPPRQAVEQYQKEYGKALDSFPSLVITQQSPKGTPPLYEKLTHVAGVGFVLETGEEAGKAKPFVWRDTVRKTNVLNMSDGPFVSFEDCGFVYSHTGFSPFVLAFPMRRGMAGVDPRWEAWREGEVLFLTYSWFHKVGIDLRSLAVLSYQQPYWKDGGGYSIDRYEQHHYVEGFVFPVPGRCIQETYPTRRTQEPAKTRVHRFQVQLTKDRLKDFKLPPTPMPNTPGAYHFPHETGQPYLTLKITRSKEGPLTGVLSAGQKTIAGKVGDVKRIPSLGNLVYQQSPTQVGWFLERKK